jgi:hypothetical protein
VSLLNDNSTNYYNVNTTKTLLFEATTEYNGKMFVFDTIELKGTQGISGTLDSYGLAVFIPLMLITASIGIGLLVGEIYIGVILVFISGWISTGLVPQYFPITYAVVTSIITGLILFGGYRRK